jgi:Leucine-rich repeat (LRR) protein
MGLLQVFPLTPDIVGGVEGLPPVLQPWTSIEELIVSNCPNLISITDLEEELHSLSRLKIENCPNLTDFIRGVASLRRLRCLVMSKCGVENLPKRLESCEELVMSNCPNLRGDCWGDLHSLTKLEIENCPKFSSWVSIQGAASLRRLVVSSCGVENLPKQLESCEELIISNCPNLRSDYWGELHSLTRLEIENCPNLTSFASMQGAASLRRLVVSSCGVEDLPKRLELCEELIISNCRNLRGGYWGDLRSLTKLEIEKCPNLKSFATIHGAASLRRLVVSSCGVKSLPAALRSRTSLKELEILDCPKLIVMPDLPGHSLTRLHVMNCPNLVSIQGAASLHRLQIWGCPNLMSFPELRGGPYLEELEIRLCPRLNFFVRLKAARSLKRLVVSFCESLVALAKGLQYCRNLEELTIWNCYNLESIPDLRGLLSLTELSIKNCRQLRCTSESLPDGLKTLVISPFCEELQSFPTFISYARFQHSLERLELCGWAILNSLPEEIQRFTAIRFLCINKCDGILALPEWLGNLFSLRSLTVDNCEKLEYFPTAEAMGSLTELEICDCPALQERCAEYTGTEWFKIAHIPIIQIDGEYIRWREGRRWMIKTNDW